MTFSKLPEKKRARERLVELVFAGRQNLVVRREGAERIKVPFAQIDKIDYEYAKRHRVGEGVMVRVLSLGAGAIVMFTKTTSHWMEIEFHAGVRGSNFCSGSTKPITRR